MLTYRADLPLSPPSLLSILSLLSLSSSPCLPIKLLRPFNHLLPCWSVNFLVGFSVCQFVVFSRPSPVSPYFFFFLQLFLSISVDLSVPCLVLLLFMSILFLFFPFYLSAMYIHVTTYFSQPFMKSLPYLFLSYSTISSVYFLPLSICSSRHFFSSLPLSIRIFLPYLQSPQTLKGRDTKLRFTFSEVKPQTCRFLSIELARLHKGVRE